MDTTCFFEGCVFLIAQTNGNVEGHFLGIESIHDIVKTTYLGPPETLHL